MINHDCKKGVMPVDAGVEVKVFFRNGMTNTGTAFGYDWSELGNSNKGYEIVSYEVTAPQPPPVDVSLAEAVKNRFDNKIPDSHTHGVNMTPEYYDTGREMTPEQTQKILNKSVLDFANNMETAAENQKKSDKEFVDNTDSPWIDSPDVDDCTTAAELAARSTLTGKQPRYTDETGEDWIDECARILTTEEFRGAMKFTIGEYNRRAGKKDEIIKEITKMQDYCSRWIKYEEKRK